MSYMKIFQSQVWEEKKGLLMYLFFLAPVEATLTNNAICQSPGVPPKVLLKSTADTDRVLLVPVPAERRGPVADRTLTSDHSFGSQTSSH